MRDAVKWTFSTSLLQFTATAVSFFGPRIQCFLSFNQAIKVDSVFKSIAVVTNEGVICDIRPLKLEDTVEEVRILLYGVRTKSSSR